MTASGVEIDQIEGVHARAVHAENSRSADGSAGDMGADDGDGQVEVFKLDRGETGVAEEGGGIEGGIAAEAATEQGMEQALAAPGWGVRGGGDMFEKKVSAAGLEDAADFGEGGGG
ncbi:MAG TPA: hypothetical protein DCY80_19645, partial [Solibacterales bacterium]|nr:hypothetical protein [Bryobacterales bacterium]